MASTKTKARVGVKSAKVLARHPVARRVTLRAAAPPAKLGWRIARRRARSELERFGGVARTTAELLVASCGAAQEIGLVQGPKPKRTGPALVLGIVIGAGAVYFLEPERGPDHRRRVQGLFGASG